ncbi:Transcription factor GTE6, partial [Linum perenne]
FHLRLLVLFSSRHRHSHHHSGTLNLNFALRLYFPVSVITMKEASVNQEDGQSKEGPDYFASYACQVKDLLSQETDFLPSSIESKGNQNGQALDQIIVRHGFSGSRSLFSNSAGATLSDYNKERLTALLPQAVKALRPEVNEMIAPVLSMRELQERITGNESVSRNMSMKRDGDGEQISDTDLQKDEDLEFLLGTDKTLVEESINKYSNELSSTLRHMENKIEELLDTVASTCRPMTNTEKLQLQKMIRNLPPENLNRVADIVQRQNSNEKQQNEEIFVNLEQEDNVTLWRLYYYVKVVERAKKIIL